MDREEAKKRVADLRGFYKHLYSYIAVNIVLVIINLVTSPRDLWFYWVTVFWGIAIIFHAFRTFGKNRILSSDWEERKIEELTKKEKKE
jgi:c-di-AMP phosphodiesterase-like protein